MEEPNKNFSNIDPDYEKYNLALKEIEEQESEENELTSERLHNIIAEEFDTELTIRQKQLEEIQDKVFKAQKLLHLVRYVLISSYYNKKSLEHSSTNESPSTSYFDPQNRIHPAVKKLLGRNSSIEELTPRGKRKVHNKSSETSVEISEQTEDCGPPNVKKVKLQETVSDNITHNIVDNSQNSLKRKKTKHRILVGNISKWMPSLENDNTTHKWMVYVRGTKEAPDVSHIIEKVVFYLHPSYKPHDVVEVSEHPFHLSRRGWGEFPLRVQIFFKCLLNKPVSIIHNLKLDKTYTGRQTLGNETVVDLYLHDSIFAKSETENVHNSNETSIPDGISEDIKVNENQIIEEEYIKKELTDSIKKENDIAIDIKDEPLPTSANLEHDYCHDNVEVKKEKDEDLEVLTLDTSLLDHTYSLPFSDFSNAPELTKMEASNSDDVDEQKDNKLIFGLGDLYGNDRCKTVKDHSKNKCVIKTFATASGQPIRVLPQSFNKVLVNNGNFVQVTLLKPPQSFLKKVDSESVLQKLSSIEESKMNSEKYKLYLPKKLFKNMGEVLPYLFKRLPLWNELAINPGFRSVYPYVASSMKEFMSWNLGKQLSSEWSRAKAVKKILCKKNFPGSEKWNTKTFFMYARSHGYSPLKSQGNLFKTPSMELELLTTCFSVSEKRQPLQDFTNNDIHIDVVDNTDSSTSSSNNTHIDISDVSLRHHCSFVKEAALDCGIVLKSEEITEGVVWNGAERMILEAVKCLANNLIRRARHHLICQEDFRNTTEIGTEEIKIALNERSDMKYITDFQKQRLKKDFFS